MTQSAAETTREVDPSTTARPKAFVGRQTIYDRDRRVFGYELLFRSGDMASAHFVDGDRATSAVIVGSFAHIGLENIVDRHPAFINVTRRFLVDCAPLPFPPEQVVLEVLEDIEVDEEVVAAVRALAERGYRIALDDFVYSTSWQPLLECAEFVKVDVRDLTSDTLATSIAQLRTYGVKLLAEKVETREEFERLHALGFDYFQGYFLSRPQVFSGERVPSSHAATLRLLSKLQDPETDVDQIERIISQDLPLSYKLLRYLNSALFGLPTEITSVGRAAVLLGLDRLRRWTMMVLMALDDDTSPSALNVALARARTCEQLAASVGRSDLDRYFTVGMFSALDLLMDAPLEVVLDEVPLPEAMRDALLEHAGPLGEALGCALAFENCAWEDIRYEKLEPEELTAVYTDALAWAFEAQRALG